MGVSSTNCTHKRGSRSHGGARLLSEDAFGLSSILKYGSFVGQEQPSHPAQIPPEPQLLRNSKVALSIAAR